jgi:hypothetical protein
MGRNQRIILPLLGFGAAATTKRKQNLLSSHFFSLGNPLADQMIF